MDVKQLYSKAKAQASTDSRAARAEANQRFVRETLARRQPEYAWTVERVAEAVARAMAQRRPAARDAIMAQARAALAAA